MSVAITPGLAQTQGRGPSPLPPVMVEADRSATPPAAQDNSGPTRRGARATQRTAPGPTAAGAPGGTQQRDGVDGYVARGTSTATKVDTPILALPRSVSTVTQQEITDRGARSVQEALTYTAGVETNSQPGNLRREYTYIRGFLAYQYLDGLKLHDSSWGFEPYGIERIDVLKGPAATLYGQGSPGGLWNMTSKRPTDQPFGEMILSAGSNGRVLGGFDLGTPLTSDKSVLFRIVGLGKFGDGEVNFSKDDRAFIAPSLTWRPNLDTSITVFMTYQYDPNLTVLQPLPAAGTITPGPNGQFISRKLFLGEPGFHNTAIEYIRAGYEFNHRLNDTFSFQQNFSYQNTKVSLYEVQSRATPNVTTTNRQMSHQEYDVDVFQVDNRLKAEFQTGPLQHHMLFGMDYAALPNFQGTGTNTSSPYSLNLYAPVYGQPLAASVPITSFRDQNVTQMGFYAQDRVQLGGLSVLFGTRFDRAVFEQETRNLAGAITNQFNVVDQKLSSHAGAIYEFANGVAPYVSYTQSFYPTTSGNATFGNVPLRPTTGEQYEAGVKYLPPGANILLAAAVFDITQNNVLTRDTRCTSCVMQIGQVQNRGAEFEAKTTNLVGFNISAAYTYLDSKVTATNTVGGIGKHPVAVPAHAASLWTTYTFAGLLEGLTLGGGVRYVGETAGDPLNTFDVPAFTLFDMMLRYRLGGISRQLNNWDVAFNVRNLFDKRYVSSCGDNLNCYYGPGRVFDATLRVRF